MFGCRHAALLPLLVFPHEQWLVAPKPWRSPQRLKIQKSEARKAAATRASLNPPTEVRYQFWGSPLPLLFLSPGCEPGWLCVAMGRGILPVVSESCSQRRDGRSLSSTAPTSRVTGPALPQVANLSHYSSSVAIQRKIGVTSPLTGVCQRRPCSCPPPRWGHVTQPSLAALFKGRFLSVVPTKATRTLNESPVAHQMPSPPQPVWQRKKQGGR